MCIIIILCIIITLVFRTALGCYDFSWLVCVCSTISICTVLSKILRYILKYILFYIDSTRGQPRNTIDVGINITEFNII